MSSVAGPGRRALVAEPSVPHSSALRRFLESAGFEVQVVHYLDEAVHRVRERELDLVFTSSSSAFAGELLCAKVKELVPACPVVLMYPAEVDDPGEQAARAGADAYLIGPVKRGAVVSTAQTMVRIRDLRQTVDRLEGDLRRHIAEPPRDLEKTEGTSSDFEFFKKYLLMEIKRARRYRHPVAFLLVALDQFTERLAGATQALRRAVLTDALRTITRAVRDIDLAVPFAENRFLVFLPHTPREGALVVASRLHGSVSNVRAVENLTASVGVAAYDPKERRAQISFGSLMKDAGEALRRAQVSGGDRVEVYGAPAQRRSRISMG
ncbi:MAG: diguanylate cyclase [Myxococcota bacterium]